VSSRSIVDPVGPPQNNCYQEMLKKARVGIVIAT
jgi:hypothetical protein